MANDGTQLMDLVYIKGLGASTTIGVYDHERDIKQELRIDIEMGCDIRSAGASDDVNQALDYDAVSKRTIEYVEASSFFLIEAVAEGLTTCLLDEFPIATLKLTISKPGAVERAKDVGLTIERTRDPL